MTKSYFFQKKVGPNFLGPQALCNSFLRFFSGSFVFDIIYGKL